MSIIQYRALSEQQHTWLKATPVMARGRHLGWVDRWSDCVWKSHCAPATVLHFTVIKIWSNVFAHYSSVRIIIQCMPAAGVPAPFPMQCLGLASHAFLHLGTGKAAALATAVVVQQVIEERNALLFQRAQELIYAQKFKDSICKYRKPQNVFSTCSCSLWGTESSLLILYLTSGLN